MEKLVTIATFEAAPPADTMKLLLEDEGFEVFVADDKLVTIDWFVSNAVGGVKLQVPESQATQAADFVERHRERVRSEARMAEQSDKPDVSFNCEECGELISFPAHRRGGVETCPRCRKYVDVPE